MKRLILAATAAALITTTATPPARAEIIEVCRAKRDGTVYWPLGQNKGKCRRGDEIFKLDRPIGGNRNVEGEGILASWFDGAIRLVASRFQSITADQPCGMFVAIDWRDGIGNVFYISNPHFGPSPNGEITPLYDPLSAQSCDEECLVVGAPAFSPALVEIPEPQGAAASGVQHHFMTDDGFHILIEDALLTWDFGGKDGCYGRATVSGRQR